MSLKESGHCQRCRFVLSYQDEAGTIFATDREAHTAEDCDKRMQATIDALKAQLVVTEKLALCAGDYKRETEAKLAGILDQNRRWQALCHREWMRGLRLRGAIMKVYAILDLKVETKDIVDESAIAVAEYTSKQLQDLIRRSKR